MFAFNDVSAIGAIRALREAGRRVPEDVSVVGFDDIPSADNQNPGLTTVRQPLRGWASSRPKRSEARRTAQRRRLSAHGVGRSRADRPRHDRPRAGRTPPRESRREFANSQFSEFMTAASRAIL